MRETAIFPDTNVFLHSRRIFDQLPWSEVLEVGPVLLVVPPVVVAELDKHKRHPRPRVRERARKVVAQLAKLSERAMECELGPGTRPRLHTARPDPSIFTETGLCPEEGDDRLLASAIEFEGPKPGYPVLVVTFDLGMSLKARAFGVPVRRLDDKWDLDRGAPTWGNSRRPSIS